MPDRIKRPKLSKALPRHGQIREPTIRKIRSITSPGFYTDKVLPPPRRHKGDLERIMKPRVGTPATPQRVGLPPSGRGLGARARRKKTITGTPMPKVKITTPPRLSLMGKLERRRKMTEEAIRKFKARR